MLEKVLRVPVDIDRILLTETLSKTISTNLLFSIKAPTCLPVNPEEEEGERIQESIAKSITLFVPTTSQVFPVGTSSDPIKTTHHPIMMMQSTPGKSEK
jgi:hypothetical protein